MLSKDLEVTLNLAFKEARAKRHEFMTVEHLLLALLDNTVAVDVLKAVGADIDRLRKDLHEFIESTTPLIPAGDSERETQPTLGFQRVLQRAVFHVQSSGRKEVTGAQRAGRDLQRAGKPGRLLPEAAEHRAHRHRQLHRARHLEGRRRRRTRLSRPSRTKTRQRAAKPGSRARSKRSQRT